MKNNKIALSILSATILLLAVTLSAFAAPNGGPVLETAVSFSEAVNLPGWLGGILTILALVLPAAAYMWMKQSRE